MKADGGSGQLNREVDRIQAMINSPQHRDMRRHGKLTTGIRPRNAATLVLVDGRPGDFRVLMGKRHHSLKFMPGALVFPGGSVDRSDGSIPAGTGLTRQTEQIIMRNMRGKPTSRAAHALGMAAIRELSEETGILLGKSGENPVTHPDWREFADRSVMPSLGGLRVLSRAITPPGPPRRFDTWFFICHIGEIAHVPAGGFRPSGELEGLQWIRPEEAIASDTREITRVMLVEAMNRLDSDPDLTAGLPAPFYQSVRNRFEKVQMT